MKPERPLKETYDFDHVITRLKGETTDAPVPLMELGVDAEIIVETTGVDLPMEQYHQLQNLALSTTDDITPEQSALIRKCAVQRRRFPVGVIPTRRTGRSSW
jgi:hypothetical protein